jgi:hypothetical protein
MSQKPWYSKLLDDLGHRGIAMAPTIPVGMVFGHILPLWTAFWLSTMTGAGIGFGALYLRERIQMARSGDTSMGDSRWLDVLGGAVGGLVGGWTGMIIGKYAFG